MNQTNFINLLRAAATHIERAIRAECHGDCRWSASDAGEYLVKALRELGAEADAGRLERARERMKGEMKADIKRAIHAVEKRQHANY